MDTQETIEVIKRTIQSVERRLALLQDPDCILAREQGGEHDAEFHAQCIASAHESLVGWREWLRKFQGAADAGQQG